MTPSDELALLRTICEQPDCDVPRLVYADWLDEHGQHDRAEFIRLQIELTGRPLTGHDLDRTKSPTYVGRNAEFPCLPNCSRCDRDRKQNRMTMLYHRGVRPHFGYEIKSNWLDDCHNAEVYPLSITRRGFGDEIRCTLAEFMGGRCSQCRLRGRYCGECYGTTVVPGLARTLFSTHPITRVVLTDQEPSEWGAEDLMWWVWTVRDKEQQQIPSDLPREIFACLQGGVLNLDNWNRRYPTRESAQQALSIAAVNYGRSLHGFSPIPG
jgi:uncharacterized protein (TIGR02996 family)